jgi:hypothetical protein
VYVTFQRNIAHNSVDARQIARNLLNASSRAGDECHPRASLKQFVYERKAKPGRASGDSNPQAVESIVRARV